jgi:hypothetical protein
MVHACRPSIRRDYYCYYYICKAINIYFSSTHYKCSEIQPDQMVRLKIHREVDVSYKGNRIGIRIRNKEDSD